MQGEEGPWLSCHSRLLLTSLGITVLRQFPKRMCTRATKDALYPPDRRPRVVPNSIDIAGPTGPPGGMLACSMCAQE